MRQGLVSSAARLRARISGSDGMTPRGDDSGFTLIELLTVTLLIGILASIAIVTFDNQQGKANDASAKSDVRNLAMVEESYLTSDTPTYGSATQLAASESLRASKGDTIWVFTQGSRGYCFVGHSSATSNYVVYNSLAGGLQSPTYTNQAAAGAVCTAAGFTAAGTISNTTGNTTAS